MFKSYSQLAKGIIALFLTLAVAASAMAASSVSIYWVVPNVGGQVTVNGSANMLLGSIKNKALSEAGIQQKYSDDYVVIAGGCGDSLDEKKTLKTLGIGNGSMLTLSLGSNPCPVEPPEAATTISDGLGDLGSIGGL